MEPTVRATQTTKSGPAEVEILGVWGGTGGRSADRILELRREGDAVHGDYDFDGSRVRGAFTDAQTFEGFWTKKRSGRNCDSEKDGSPYRGHLRLEFESPERDRLNGLGRYCGSDEADWSPKGWQDIERLL